MTVLEDNSYIHAIQFQISYFEIEENAILVFVDTTVINHAQRMLWEISVKKCNSNDTQICHHVRGCLQTSITTDSITSNNTDGSIFVFCRKIFFFY